MGPALRALRPALAFFHRLWERHPACYRELNAVSIGFALAARQMASIRVRGRGWIRGPGQPNTVGSLSGPLLAGHHGGASKFATEVPHFSEAAVWRVVNSEHEGRAPEARARMGPERCELSWTASRRAGQSTTSSSGHLWSIGLTGSWTPSIRREWYHRFRISVGWQQPSMCRADSGHRGSTKDTGFTIATRNSQEGSCFQLATRGWRRVNLLAGAWAAKLFPSAPDPSKSSPHEPLLGLAHTHPLLSRADGAHREAVEWGEWGGKRKHSVSFTLRNQCLYCGITVFTAFELLGACGYKNLRMSPCCCSPILFTITTSPALYTHS